MKIFQKKYVQVYFLSLFLTLVLVITIKNINLEQLLLFLIWSAYFWLFSIKTRQHYFLSICSSLFCFMLLVYYIYNDKPAPTIFRYLFPIMGLIIILIKYIRNDDTY